MRFNIADKELFILQLSLHIKFKLISLNVVPLTIELSLDEVKHFTLWIILFKDIVC